MNSKIFNLAFMFVWLLLCAAMLTRGWWMTDDMRENVSDQRAYLIVLVSVVFALWNFARFFAASRYAASAKPSPEVEEYRRRIRAMSGNDPKVTDPQFNFDDPPPDEPPRAAPPA